MVDIGWYICPACHKNGHHILEMDLSGNLYCNGMDYYNYRGKPIYSDILKEFKAQYHEFMILGWFSQYCWLRGVAHE